MLLNSATADMALPAERSPDHPVADGLLKTDEESVGGYHRCPALRSRLSPWLAPLMYGLGEKVILPFYFSQIKVIGQHNIPARGPVILAPTHQARWDALLVGLVGKRAGRYLRFMVTADECVGIQGWFIKRLGGFPVHVRRPSVKTLRHGVQLLQEKEMLVIYPEGDIYRDRINPLKPGLARIALRAEYSQPKLNVKIVPISLRYSEICPKWRGQVEVVVGSPISVADYTAGNGAAPLKEDRKQQSKQLTADLQRELMMLAERCHSQR
ncbi:MAG: 1-acyl-sn-glycerol-3-phosphate acyltransferase [Phormidesmis priestleyi Ana]|uniref:1-acyl-sn-glycerol-3-phosphate acyltransferase n=1 Tax=Phormidesmis priestleyi Ana TaxID=1666911 RepID=A0A0P7ZVB0_9CYAN|nr:MAG: 1-acyl-sn-glycerol-3-phosphate acyltransferase [Phormidesmis priestleyi Ana]